MRGSSFIDFLASLVHPLQYNQDILDVFEVDIRTRLRYSGQIIVLAASLNEINSITTAPFIRVETNRDAAAIPAFVYDELDGVPTLTIYDELDGDADYIVPDPNQGNLIPDFRVLIPSGLWTQDLEDAVRSDTQLYKIAGQSFEIIQY